jgi:hypothetical protein
MPGAEEGIWAIQMQIELKPKPILKKQQKKQEQSSVKSMRSDTVNL